METLSDYLYKVFPKIRELMKPFIGVTPPILGDQKWANFIGLFFTGHSCQIILHGLNPDNTFAFWWDPNTGKLTVTRRDRSHLRQIMPLRPEDIPNNLVIPPDQRNAKTQVTFNL